MESNILGKCPVCSEKLIATELTCDKCGTVIKGRFTFSNFDKLTEPQMKFAEIFLKDGGNIKAVEKDLNISYPTVKRLLAEVISSLGLPTDQTYMENEDTRESILAELKAGKIDFEEAEKRLSDIGEPIK